MEITKTMLKSFLLFSKTTKNHHDSIMICKTIKEAHIYCKYNKISGQSSGVFIEKFIQKKFNFIKNNANLCSGDLKSKKSNKNVEIKVSLGGVENNKFNFVQIRLNHNCDYILTAYYLHENNVENFGDLYIFKLNKQNIKKIILKHGQYAHGTIKKLGKITKNNIKSIENNKEYCIRPKYRSKCWNELLKHRIDEEDLYKC